MKRGGLTRYFDGVAIKLLQAVEIDSQTSNQHELNGVTGLREILGQPEGKMRYQAKFLYLSDYRDDTETEDGFLTWYDARERARLERGVMRSEYRLYFPSNRVFAKAAVGDVLVTAKRPDNTLLIVIAKAETTAARQMLWLFNVPNPSGSGFSVCTGLDAEEGKSLLPVRLILESVGIEIEYEDMFLDEMLRRFGGVFPTTEEFSEFARSTLPEVTAKDDPDGALTAWVGREEMLFRTLERRLVGERLAQGFAEEDVDGFISYALSVLNRRKSRAGFAVENHLEFIFCQLDIRYSRNQVTENRSKPDFLFPGRDEYHDREFNALLLTMLGVKLSCKERWRQVLSEADRIENKHLLTLEAAISERQTDEMKMRKLQLVLPEELHESYSPEQQRWLMNVTDFTNLALDRQRKAL